MKPFLFDGEFFVDGFKTFWLDFINLLNFLMNKNR